MACDDGLDPGIRALVIALAEMEKVMALDLSKLQTDVAAQGALIAQLQTQITTGSSADQAAVDGIAASVETNNAALAALVTPTP